MQFIISFAEQIRLEELPEPVAEYKFCSTRKWRLDWAWPEQKLALEIEGGIWTRGRHTRPRGFINDMEKYNQLAIIGWRLIRVTPQQIRSGEAITIVRQCLATN